MKFPGLTATASCLHNASLIVILNLIQNLTENALPHTFFCEIPGQARDDARAAGGVSIKKPSREGIYLIAIHLEFQRYFVGA